MDQNWRVTLLVEETMPLINGLQFPVLLRVFQKVENDSDSELVRAVDSCKTLARIIKAQRIPTFVFP